MAAQTTSFLDETFLKNLEKLKIITQKGVKGPERGEHKSRQSGEGQEFLDYRTYQAGDDLRYVDWSVYGRLDKLFIKLFHAEEDQPLHILLDVSRSMGFGSPPKIVSAQKIAAAVSYIGLANLDKIRLSTFGDTLRDMHPLARGKRKYAALLKFLFDAQPAPTTGINQALREYANICRDPGLILILSDLFDPQGYQDGLKALTYRKFEIHVIQVLDHAEIAWAQTGTFLLRDLETGEQKVTVIDHTLAAAYQRQLQAFITEAKRFCDAYNISYAVYDTLMPFEDFLINYVTRHANFR